MEDDHVFLHLKGAECQLRHSLNQVEWMWCSTSTCVRLALMGGSMMLQISDGVSSVKTLLTIVRSVEGTMTLAYMNAMSVKKAK